MTNEHDPLSTVLSDVKHKMFFFVFFLILFVIIYRSSPSVKSNTLATPPSLTLVSAPNLSSPAPPRTTSNTWCDEVQSGADRSVVRTAAFHGGAGLIGVGGVELALVDIRDLRHIVAKSVGPARSVERLNPFY